MIVEEGVVGEGVVEEEGHVGVDLVGQTMEVNCVLTFHVFKALPCSL